LCAGTFGRVCMRAFVDPRLMQTPGVPCEEKDVRIARRTSPYRPEFGPGGPGPKERIDNAGKGVGG
jgi:hypothetical protein